MAFVPSLKSRISATPTGPFHTTVPAPANLCEKSATDLGPISSAIQPASTASDSMMRNSWPGLLRRAVLDEAAAGRPAARLEEGVGHRAADQQSIYFLQQVAEDSDLGRNL